MSELVKEKLVGGYKLSDSDWAKLFEQTSCKTLSIAALGLTEVPAGLNKLTNLTSLDISENTLTAIPPEVFELPELTELQLFQNKITAIPKELTQLSKLEDLNMFNNQIKTVAPEINDCVSLTSLNLGKKRWCSHYVPWSSHIFSLTRSIPYLVFSSDSCTRQQQSPLILVIQLNAMQAIIISCSFLTSAS